jgi:hypothetical protein
MADLQNNEVIECRRVPGECFGYFFLHKIVCELFWQKNSPNESYVDFKLHEIPFVFNCRICHNFCTKI